MKAFSTMGSKRGKGKRGFTLIELLIVMVILAILAGVVVMAVGGVFGQAKEQAYNTIKPQIQNAVTAHMVDTAGERPLVNFSSGCQYTIAGVGALDVINMCDIVGTPSADLLRTVPDGCYQGGSNDNFDNSSCTLTQSAAGGHYVWLVDVAGNVYSVCDSDEDGTVDADELCDGFSGCQNSTSSDPREVWP